MENSSFLKEIKLVKIARERFIKHKQFLLYGIIGVSGALLDLIIFTILFNIFHLDKNIAKTISVSFGIANTFALNLIFNFKVRNKLILRFLSYFCVGYFGLFVAVVIFYIFVDQFKFNTNLVNLLSIPIIVLIQYNINKFVSFKGHKNV